VPSEISELLEEAQAGAPPLRYDVDYVWAAGRRRRRRRTAGWAIAAVVAVAAAIGVPQIASHSAAPVPVAPAVPKPEFTYRGFDVGVLHVTSPQIWDLARQYSEIREGKEPIGTFNVYRPGVRMQENGRYKRVPAGDVNGRPANFLEENGKVFRLEFEYADDAYAQLLLIGPEQRRDEMLQVARAFRQTDPYPVTLGFRSEYIPAGYQLVGLAGPVEGRVSSQAEFVPADQAEIMLSRPDRQLPTAPGKGSTEKTFSITLETTGGDVRGDSPERTEANCTSPAVNSPRAMCQVWISGGKWFLDASGPGGTYSEVRKMIDAATVVTDPKNTATWLAVDRALPESTLATVRKM
jgi:hypothetical protein